MGLCCSKAARAPLPLRSLSPISAMRLAAPCPLVRCRCIAGQLLFGVGDPGEPRSRRSGIVAGRIEATLVGAALSGEVTREAVLDDAPRCCAGVSRGVARGFRAGRDTGGHASVREISQTFIPCLKKRLGKVFCATDEHRLTQMNDRSSSADQCSSVAKFFFKRSPTSGAGLCSPS